MYRAVQTFMDISTSTGLRLVGGIGINEATGELETNDISLLNDGFPPADVDGVNGFVFSTTIPSFSERLLLSSASRFPV